jgi:glyoxylase-like metal-dependent hydrolase (beta-lactamase superfamily II)
MGLVPIRKKKTAENADARREENSACGPVPYGEGGERFMRMTESVHWIACGFVGPWFTNRNDGNVYLLRGPDGFVMADAGCGVEPELIERQMRWDGVRPRDIQTIVLTHAHGDHAGGARYWREKTGARVLVSEKSAARVRRGGEYHPGKPGESVIEACPAAEPVSNGQKLILAGLNFEVIETPGHSDTAVCWLTELDGAKILISGDCFYWGGKTTVFYFPDACRKTFRKSLETLQTVDFDAFLPGHRYPVLAGGKDHLPLAIAELDRQIAGQAAMGG